MSATNTWWARQWESLRQELGFAAESGRTGSPARVKRLEVLPGQISAVMQEKDAGACHIEVRVTPLHPEQWEHVGELLSKLAMVNAQILSGAMPPEIEQVFAEAGARLLPTRGEIAAVCSCCPSNACRHLPQIFSLFAEMLNDDPGLLFTLRGRDRQQVLRDVREVRASASSQPPAGSTSSVPAEGVSGAIFGSAAGAHLFGGHPHAPATSPLESAASSAGSTAPGEPGLGAQIDQYWGNRKLLKQFHHHIAPPQVELSLLRRLGPINTSDDAMALYQQMVALYRRITEDALALAYASDDDAAVAANGNTGNGSSTANGAGGISPAR